MLILPLVVEQLLAVAIGMADTVMVATCGEAAVAGISNVDSINMLLIQVFAALATGGAVVAAQYLGRKDNEKACDAAKQLHIVTIIISIVIMAIALIFNKQILRAIFGKIDSDVMDNAVTYLFLSALSYPFLALYNCGAALYRAMGNSKISMITSLIMNVINIGGNAIFIYGFNMGVFGAGLASLISRAVSAVIMFVLIQNKKKPIHLENLKPKWNGATVKRILRIGIPTGVENSMFQLGKLLVQGLVATLGTAAMAANAISMSISGIANVPGQAVGLALITVVGQCFGAGEYDEAGKYTKKLIIVTYIALFAVSVTLFFSAPPLIHMFNLSAEATDIAVQILRIFCMVTVVFWPLSFCLPNALRAAGDAKFTMIVSVISMTVFRVGSSFFFVLVLHLGVEGVWISMYIDWAVRALFFLVRFLRGKWKKIRII